MLAFPYRYGQQGGGDVEIVSWTDGATAKVKAMLDAEKAGKINTSDYWNMGDKRTFQLSAIPAYTVGGVEIIAAQAAQEIEIALAHKGLYKDANNNTVSWVATFVNCLSAQGKINGTATNAGSWGAAAIRGYINNCVFPAMSAADQALFLQFKTITANPYNGTTLETSIDYLALFAEKELFGTATYGNTTEADALTQIDYYKIQANHNKTANGSLCYWWERSPVQTYNDAFCLSNVGYASLAGATAINGISPFGCI